MQTPNIYNHKKLVTTTLYYVQNITSKMVSSGILSPEEGLVWVFSKCNIYVLKNTTPLYKVGSYSKNTDACSLPIWSQKTASGEQVYVLG